MRIKILILSLILILTISITTFAVDESGNVVSSSVSLNCSRFESYFNFDYSSPFSSGYTSSFDSNYFNRMFFDPSVTYNGIYTIYNMYFRDSFIFPDDYNYLVLSVDVGAISSSVLVQYPDIIVYTSSGTTLTLTNSADISYVDLNYSGSNFNAVKVSYIVDVSKSTFDISSLSQFWVRYDFRTSGSYSAPFVMSPLTLEFYDDYEDVIVDLNNNVQEIINQNDIIINNLGEVNDKLDELINTDIDESKKEEFEDEISKDIEDMESIFDLEESVGNNANDKLNVSIDYDTSYTNQALKDVLDNNIFSNFFNYLFDYPFVVIVFTLLPFLWVSYILLYRG